MNPISPYTQQTNHPAQSHHDTPKTYISQHFPQEYLTKARLSLTLGNDKVSFQTTFSPVCFLGFVSRLILSSPRSSIFTYGSNLLISFISTGHGNPLAPITYINTVIEKLTSILNWTTPFFPLWIYSGFNTIPPLPAKRASFSIIPKSNFCQFRATSCAPVLQNTAGS